MIVLFKLLLLFDITEYVERDISHFCKKSKESELDQGGEGEAAVINETDSLGFIGLPAFHPGWEVSTFYGCWRGRRRGVTGGVSHCFGGGVWAGEGVNQVLDYCLSLVSLSHQRHCYYCVCCF